MYSQNHLIMDNLCKKMHLQDFTIAVVSSFSYASKMLAYLALRAPAIPTIATLPSFVIVANATRLGDNSTRKVGKNCEALHDWLPHNSSLLLHNSEARVLHNYSSFREFVEDWLRISLEDLKAICTTRCDYEALDLVDKVTKGKQGQRNDLVDNVNYVNSPDGNANTYALRKLRKDRPDLHAKVISCQLSCQHDRQMSHGVPLGNNYGNEVPRKSNHRLHTKLQITGWLYQPREVLNDVQR